TLNPAPGRGSTPGRMCGGSQFGAAGLAAAVAAALTQRGKRAALSFVAPECNTLGLALLRPRALEEALALAQTGAAATAIVLENDLFRRAPADEVEALLARFGPGQPRHLIVLDQIGHRTAEAAELLLPAASFAEGDGTLVNNEGRAQRSFQVLAPQAGIRESWRWLEQAQGRDPSLDELIGAVAAEFPELGAIRAAAPAAGFRLAGEKVPRETLRFSGRTAIHAGVVVSEPKPPEDADSALSFTMEGYAAQPPAALTPFFWAPGWNSPQAAFTYQQEINAALRGGDAGALLLQPEGTAQPAAWPAPQVAFAPRADAWWLLRLHHLFGSEELSQLGEAIAELAPTAYVALSPAAAAEAGWTAGEMLEIQVNGSAWQAPLRLVPELPAGAAAVPAGVAAFDGAALPAWCRLTAAGGRS
ncbi:MAG: molybdopterin-dependent oxidoreductase, partial [Terriglobales bacterium]